MIILQFKTEEAQSAWLAGIIDGEGSITFDGQKRACPRPKISISNSNKDLMDAVKIHCASENVQLSRPEGHNRWGNKPQYLLRLRGARLRRLLPRIIPFLVAKRRQAELALELLELKKDWRSFVKQYGLATYRQRCMEIRQKIMSLNVQATGRGYRKPL